MTRIISIYFMLLIPVLSFSQDLYENGSIQLRNGEKIEAEEISLTNSEVRFTTPDEKATKTLGLAELNYLRVKSGNHARRGAWMGGLAIAGVGVSAVFYYHSDSETSYSGTEILISIGIVGGGVAIGALIGSSHSSYYTVYEAKSYNGYISQATHIGLTKHGLGIVHTF